MTGQFTGKALKGFYALEGIDGAGKTTLVSALKELSREEGADATLLFHAEPTSGTTGLYCRKIAEGAAQANPPPSLAAYLFAADRYQHLYDRDSGILSLLESGKKVFTDRYLYSSIVYQTCMEDSREDASQRRELARRLNRDFERPEKVFFLKCPPELALERQVKRGKKPIDSLERLATLDTEYETALGALEALPDGAGDSPVVVRLDASKGAEELAKTVYGQIFC